MKKLLAIFIVLLLIPLAFAQAEVNNEELEISEPDYSEIPLPGSFSRGLNRVIERVRLGLTFNPEKRVELRLESALRRLQEIHEMQRRGKIERINKTLEEFEKQYYAVGKDIDAAIKRGANTTELEEYCHEMIQKQTQVLERIMEITPEQAQPALQRALERSQAQERFHDQYLKQETRPPVDDKIPKSSGKQENITSGPIF